ncbi:hypothetical protein [Streptomyces sp. VRA16 Mangrove soil]|uniref:hypothetical protein n=1 Tax=Streptomyces sp. VRA16 Mangrove soil TaxID=2817434 RepID=UPI001AA00B53|nr:hypothetical protein [Streptomyces sp. VRA16 Mangrove soil]MBO1333615.1 hypothetical protein [Streptomyces sp. VRA16 Mangrove soil]
MHGYYVDDLVLITPVQHPAGVRLIGRLIGAHKVPLTQAVQEQSRGCREVVVDLTGVDYLANSALETLVAVARTLGPPRCLDVRAPARLGLGERLTGHGWDGVETLRLTLV